MVDTLRLLRDPNHPPIESLAPDFTEAGRQVPGLLFDVLVARRVPASEDVPSQGLSIFQRDLILASYEEMGRSFVYHTIGERLQEPVEIAERRAAIEVLGAIGTSDDLLRVFDLALTDDEERTSRGMDAAFRCSIAGILERDPRAFHRLSRSWRSEREELQATLVLAVGDSGSSDALEFLADVILWDEDLAVVAMAQIPRVGRSEDEHLNEELRVRLRHFLDPGQPGHCRSACLALAELEDTEAIPYLIDLLASDYADAGIKTNATRALQTITGLRFPPDVRRWNHWYEGELNWMRRERAREFRRIMSHDEVQVAKGLREVAKHPFAKDELIHTLRSILIDRNEEVRVLACKALADHGNDHVVPWLIDALEDSDPEVRYAAWEALKKLTGLELTPLEWAMRAFALGN